MAEKVEMNRWVQEKMEFISRYGGGNVQLNPDGTYEIRSEIDWSPEYSRNEIYKGKGEYEIRKSGDGDGYEVFIMEKGTKDWSVGGGEEEPEAWTEVKKVKEKSIGKVEDVRLNGRVFKFGDYLVANLEVDPQNCFDESICFRIHRFCDKFVSENAAQDYGLVVLHGNGNFQYRCVSSSRDSEAIIHTRVSGRMALRIYDTVHEKATHFDIALIAEKFKSWNAVDAEEPEKWEDQDLPAAGSVGMKAETGDLKNVKMLKQAMIWIKGATNQQKGWKYADGFVGGRDKMVALVDPKKGKEEGEEEEGEVGEGEKDKCRILKLEEFQKFMKKTQGDFMRKLIDHEMNRV